MSPEAAFDNFMQSFGVTAYSATAVPVNAGYPRITYTYGGAFFGDGEIPVAVDVWCRTETESEPNALARIIANAVGLGGVLLKCDTGTIWVKRGEPFVQSMVDPNDVAVKRRYINLTLEFFTQP